MNKNTVFICVCLLTILLSNCKHESYNIDYQRKSLSSENSCVLNNWQFKYQNKWYDAAVPGNIHDDLLQNKLIPDPFLEDNESLVQWVSDSVWEYRLLFDNNCSNGKRFSHNQLIFEGLDTYAEVFVNGEKLKSIDGDSLTINMFRKWIFNLPNNLNDTANELIVRFLPTKSFDSVSASKLPYQLPDNRVFTRKAQYESGWDWGPKLNTCGIWKNVYIESWNDLKINDFYVSDVEPSFDANRPWISEVEIDIDADRIFSTELLLEITDADGYNQSVKQKIDLRQGNNIVKIPVNIENPKLWWPNGSGDQHLYYFTVSYSNQDGEQQYQTVHTHGLRTIRLEQNPDSIGESFQFYVNEKPLFMRGVNWIPVSSYLGTLVNSEGYNVYYDLLKRCADANMNMVRIWGGGIYEHDAFYDICDQLGLLVWQDFMFACNIFPGDKKFLENVNIESKEQIKRMKNHSSIAIYCGNNEVHNGLEDWGWQKQFGYSDAQYAQMYADYDAIFNKILLDNCRNLAPKTPYIHSSPTFGWGHPECTTNGCSHYWGVWWGELPFEIYKEKTGRFMTEYGFQSYPEIASINEFAAKKSQKLDSPTMLNHQKHARGVQIISKAIEDLYGKFNTNDFEKFVYLSQLTQADGISQAIETHRIQHNKCSGTLVWQLNDCWPVASWSCIDYYGRPKALYYRLPSLFDNIAIASQKNDDNSIDLYVINDSFDEIDGVFTWKIAKNSDDSVVDSGSVEVKIHDYSSKLVKNVALPKNLKIPGEYHIKTEFVYGDNVKKYYAYFAKPRDIVYGKSAINFKTDYYDHYAVIKISSKSLQKGVFIEESEGNLVNYSDNYFDLLPGEEIEIRVDYPNLDIKPKFLVRAL